MQERLQKILAHAGVASRRKAEELILAGSVVVNGKTVMELGTKADLSVDHIKVNGKLIRPPTGPIYIAMNKPAGYVTTTSDPEGRATIMDLIKGLRDRVYPVGRLDYHSEGLILLTNDGDFANKIMSSHTDLVKTYVVKVTGRLTPEQEEQFRTGIPLLGRKTLPAGLTLIKNAANPWYEVQLTEGRQNQIRMMFKYCGRLVEKLKRVRIGFLALGNLKPGEYRALTTAELVRFKRRLKLPLDGEKPDGADDAEATPKPKAANKPKRMTAAQRAKGKVD